MRKKPRRFSPQLRRQRPTRRAMRVARRVARRWRATEQPRQQESERTEPVRPLTDQEATALRAALAAIAAQVERGNAVADPFAEFMEADHV